MRGPCAKQVVTATIVTVDGQRFTGTNDCFSPQDVCPRADLPTGQGYHLCQSICRKTGHAEVNALRAAGAAAMGATLYLTGHSYACEPCTRAAAASGITAIVIGSPPHDEISA